MSPGSVVTPRLPELASAVTGIVRVPELGFAFWPLKHQQLLEIHIEAVILQHRKDSR